MCFKGLAQWLHGIGTQYMLIITAEWIITEWIEVIKTNKDKCLITALWDVSHDRDIYMFLSMTMRLPLVLIIRLLCRLIIQCLQSGLNSKIYINKYSNLRCVCVKKPVYSHIQKQEILGKKNLDFMNATAPMVNFILLLPFFQLDTMWKTRLFLICMG